jgi:4,5-DOPA dioxygenase extradiol
LTSNKTAFSASKQRTPAVFVGHGSPMNIVEDNAFSLAWAETGRRLPPPKAVLCISAHWETEGCRVTAMDKPRTIHDFYGFPRELYSRRYPAPGSPALAHLVQETVKPVPVELDTSWGLDHGAWSVLSRMFPGADVPVVQLSLDRTQPPAFHFELGQALRPLRKRGVLVLGSGNIVHNLGMIDWEGGAYPWAVEFDETVRRLIVAGDHQGLVDYVRLGRSASLSIPTNEHYLPLLYALGLQEAGEEPEFFAEGVVLGSISMRSFRLG